MVYVNKSANTMQISFALTLANIASMLALVVFAADPLEREKVIKVVNETHTQQFHLFIYFNLMWFCCSLWKGC